MLDRFVLFYDARSALLGGHTNTNRNVPHMNESRFKGESRSWSLVGRARPLPGPLAVSLAASLAVPLAVSLVVGPDSLLTHVRDSY